MTTQPNTASRSFQFRTAKGRWLNDEIASIEKLATDLLREGVAHHSVQTGAFSLLKIAMEGVATELVMESALIQACTPTAQPPRYDQPEAPR